MYRYQVQVPTVPPNHGAPSYIFAKSKRFLSVQVQVIAEVESTKHAAESNGAGRQRAPGARRPAPRRAVRAAASIALPRFGRTQPAQQLYCTDRGGSLIAKIGIITLQGIFLERTPPQAMPEDGADEELTHDEARFANFSSRSLIPFECPMHSDISKLASILDR